MARRQIGEILREQGLLTEAQLQEALTLQKSSPSSRLGQILVEKGFAREQDIAKALALQEGLPYQEVSSLTIPPKSLLTFLWILPSGTRSCPSPGRGRP